MATYTTNIVTTVAYMIGVKKHLIAEIHQGEEEELTALYENQNATAIRYLCKLRTKLMLNFKNTDKEMKYNITNIDKLKWFDRENIMQLEEWGYKIIKTNFTSQKYMELITKLISENIGKCQTLFPEWVNWQYIKDLFIVPHFTRPNVLKSEFIKYMSHIEYYPFQLYIHWNPRDCGGMLYNDGKFLNIIYEQHGDVFVGKSKYKDADLAVKERIYQFIQDTDNVEIIVDCENSNCYKLCGVLTSLDANELSKIRKILLFDDAHSDPGWNLVERFVKIPVEHIMVDRVKEQKSLVDMKVTVGVCNEHYRNNVSSFILLSSDSDYWALISSLPDAKFLVMVEYSKVSEAIKTTLSQNNIFYCAIDDFYTGRIDDFKKFVLFDLLKKYLPNILQYNGKELVAKLYSEAKIIADQNEQNNFYKKYIQTLKFVADDNGNLSLEIQR